MPGGTGWILDGFLATLKQAVLLEKVFSGYDAAAMGDDLLEPASHASTEKTFSKSSLVPDLRPPRPPPSPVSRLVSLSLSIYQMIIVWSELCKLMSVYLFHVLISVPCADVG